MNHAKHWIVTLLGCVLLGVLWPGHVAAQSDRKYREALVEMLDASQALGTLETMLQQMLPEWRQSAPQVPAAFWQKMEERWSFERLKERLIDLYVPIYRARFSVDDLHAITEFYRTPVGAKLAAATPTMTLEAMAAGEQLGWELLSELQHELKAALNEASEVEGPADNSARQAAGESKSGD